MKLKKQLRKFLLWFCDTYLGDKPDAPENLVGCVVVLKQAWTQRHKDKGDGLTFSEGFTFTVQAVTKADKKHTWYEEGDGYKLVDAQNWPVFNVPRDAFLVTKHSQSRR